MKKASLKIKKFSFIFLTGCFFILNTSCGLDTFEVINTPIQTQIGPIFDGEGDTQDFLGKQFSFTTNENNSNYLQVKFLGTGVYYKIYNNFYDMKSERSSLISLMESTENSANSATKMIQSYSYQTLTVSDDKSNILIPNQNKNQIINIRLSNYDSGDFKAKLTVDNKSVSGNEGYSIPLRYNGKTFDFGRTGEKDGIPEEDDSDFKKNSTDSHFYYIPMFAVGIARDTTYTYQYSNIIYLGTVLIDSTTENN